MPVVTKNWIINKKAHLRKWNMTSLAAQQVIVGASTQCSSSYSSETLVDTLVWCLHFCPECGRGTQACWLSAPSCASPPEFRLWGTALNITLHSHNYSTDVFHSHQNYNASFNKFLKWQPKCLYLIGSLLYLFISVSLHPLIQLSSASTHSWQLMY